MSIDFISINSIITDFPIISMDNKTAGTVSPKQKPKRHKGKTKPKMTKEERRAKYTAIAHDRRDKRMQRAREKDITCYRCRKKGHSAENCTASGDVRTKKGGMICYKCGSTEHRIQMCVKIKPYLKGKDTKLDFGKLGELPFANCFVCNESGHLSSYCPQNKKGGIFPDGGVCRECGEAGHFAKDCPKKSGKDDDDGSVSSNSVTIEQYLEDEEDKEVKKAPKKKKVVKF